MEYDLVKVKSYFYNNINYFSKFLISLIRKGEYCKENY